MTRTIIVSPACVVLMLLATASLPAQSKWDVPEDFKDYATFIKIPLTPMPHREDLTLPRVLIIGDSISMYYTEQVRHLMEGKANVYRAPDNCRNTGYGLKNIDYWLGDGRWKAIHFNFGLHDLLIMKATGKEQVSQDDYDKNLRAILKRLQATGARVIWASTTPVPEGTHSRSEADAVAYNAIARRIMDENHIPIDDLHAFVEVHKDKIERWQYPQDVHFRPEGCVELANEVVKSIEDALEPKRSPEP